jgi:hypothetical protein
VRHGLFLSHSRLAGWLTNAATQRRPQLESVARRFEDKPVIGFVATLLHDYVPLIDEYYYCASRSLLVLRRATRNLTRLLARADTA